MKLVNTSNRDRHIPLSEGVVLAPGESVDLTPDDVLRLERYPVVSNWIHLGFLTMGEPEQVEEAPEDGVHIQEHGSGWYSVHVNGFKVTDVKVREEEALRIAAEYEL